MPKGRHIIHYKQKRAAHWAARFLRLWDFVTTISTARRNFSFLWLDWIELLNSMGGRMERHVAGGLLLYLVWATLYAPNNPIHSRESLLSLWDGWDRASG